MALISSRWRPLLARLMLALLVAGAAGAIPGLAAAGLAPDSPIPAAPFEFTLVTGDTVTVTPGANGTLGAELSAAASDVDPGALAALPEYARLDAAFFDAPYLIKEGFPLAGGWPVIVDLDDVTDPRDFTEGAAAQGVTFTEVSRELNLWAARLPARRSGALTRELLAQGGVRKIWLDAYAEAALDVSVPLVGAPALWSAGFSGQGVTIAILDTGVNPAHPDFQARVTLRTFFITCPSAPPCPDYNPNDENSHGTHVAGIAAGDGPVYKGVAPGANLWGVKVLGANGRGSVSNIIKGIEFAAKGPDDTPNTGDEADIINLSLGAGLSGDGNDLLSQAADLAVQQGLVVVAAAGNSGKDANGDGMKDQFTLLQPAVARQVITVGATNDFDSIPFFSSSGPTADWRLKPDITAPGVNILSASYTGSGYITKLGTSMSTPHVAGAAALLRQQHPAWSPELVKAALMGSALPLSGPRLWEQGAGRLRIDQAAATPLLATPPSLSFGDLTAAGGPVTQNVTLHNVDAEPLTVSPTVAAVSGGLPLDGVTVSPPSVTVPAGGTAHVTVSVNPNSYVGWHEGRVWLDYGSGAISVPYLFRWQPEIPKMTLSPTSFDVVTPRGAAAQRELTISNLGPGQLQFSLALSDVAEQEGAAIEFAATPASGAVEEGGSATVQLTLETDGIPGGVYHTALLVEHNGLGEKPAAVPITLTVETAQISGAATLQRRADHSGVVLQFSGPESQTVTTGASGSFALELNPGLYQVWATYPYYLPATAIANLPAGAQSWSVELLLGDWNGDEAVDLLDLRPIADNIGQAAAGGGDADGNGRLDGLDLALTARNFSRQVSPWQQGPS